MTLEVEALSFAQVEFETFLAHVSESVGFECHTLSRINNLIVFGNIQVSQSILKNNWLTAHVKRAVFYIFLQVPQNYAIG